MVFGSEDLNKIESCLIKIVTKTSHNGMNKLTILTFGDISQTQYTNAKPILDKYGFKGSFFVTCDWVGTVDDDKSPRMSWQMIQALHNQGQDMESKADVTQRFKWLVLQGFGI